MSKEDMIEFIIEFGGVDDLELRKQLNEKSDKLLKELFEFTKYVAKMLG